MGQLARASVQRKVPEFLWAKRQLETYLWAHGGAEGGGQVAEVGHLRD